MINLWRLWCINQCELLTTREKFPYTHNWRWPLKAKGKPIQHRDVYNGHESGLYLFSFSNQSYSLEFRCTQETCYGLN